VDETGLGDPATSDAGEALRRVAALLPHLDVAGLHRLRTGLIPAEQRRRVVGLPGPAGEAGSKAVNGKVGGR
jgi:hypothetical protein